MRNCCVWQQSSLGNTFQHLLRPPVLLLSYFPEGLQTNIQGLFKYKHFFVNRPIGGGSHLALYNGRGNTVYSRSTNVTWQFLSQISFSYLSFCESLWSKDTDFIFGQRGRAHCYFPIFNSTTKGGCVYGTSFCLFFP